MLTDSTLCSQTQLIRPSCKRGAIGAGTGQGISGTGFLFSERHLDWSLVVFDERAAGPASPNPTLRSSEPQSPSLTGPFKPPGPGDSAKRSPVSPRNARTASPR
ncbi:hypothetical protein SKAU_G00314330 [Synaphobranchus kaupii]|uniref:Uncharacterized protein n=1 Tax=Synaphobranchus kaupii TaxID=118154 RepID=A0A9Q1ESD5_SYNKA|nr:hypothetical protein SKAU_G00314330 [Synaphobranchus kaupii]